MSITEILRIQNSNGKIVQIFRTEYGDRLFLNEVEVAEYDRICQLVVDANMVRCAMLVQHNDEKFIWLDKKEHPPYRNICYMAFSPAGTHFVYCVTKKNNKKSVVYDGTVQRGYDDITGFRFSPQGMLAYKAFSDFENKWCMVVGGKEDNSWYDNISSCVWSSSGKYAYIAYDGGLQCAVLNGKEDTWHKSITKIRFELFPQLHVVTSECRRV